MPSARGKTFREVGRSFLLKYEGEKKKADVTRGSHTEDGRLTGCRGPAPADRATRDQGQLCGAGHELQGSLACTGATCTRSYESCVTKPVPVFLRPSAALWA